MKRLMAVVFFAFLMVGFGFAEQDVTSERQRLFSEIDEAHDALEDQMDAEQWAEMVLAAREQADKIDGLALLFPESSVGEGRSRKKIWSNWDNFSTRLSDLSLHYADIERAIIGEDFDAAEKALKAANSGCNSCHMAYRSLW
ncbi:MAG: cytochrome c [Natronospirillum sp.]